MVVDRSNKNTDGKGLCKSSSATHLYDLFCFSSELLIFYKGK